MRRIINSRAQIWYWMTVNQHNVVHILPRVFEFKSFPVTIVTESISINDFSNGGHTPEFESIWSGAPNDRFLGNDLKWLVMHPVVL